MGRFRLVSFQQPFMRVREEAHEQQIDAIARRSVIFVCSPEVVWMPQGVNSHPERVRSHC